MKRVLGITLLVLFSCSETVELSKKDYSCAQVMPDSSTTHPLNSEITTLVDKYIKKGIPGLNLMVKTSDQHVWIGAGGKADLWNKINLEPCHRMLIASISKVFTATLVFHLREQGLLSLDDRLSDHLSGKYMNEIINAKKVTIRQLLNHTSGLYDYLDPLKYELISINNPYGSDSPSEKLKLAYGKKPSGKPGEKYYYSNTNFVLLGLLIENLSSKPLNVFMDEVIFTPLNLSSGIMGTPQKPIPEGTPKGYLSLHANNDLQDSEFYYHYDLATGDGGVAINMHDLGLFFELLHKGAVINQESLDLMQESFELPEGWKGLYHEFNGHGFEIYETEYGIANGHTGAIVGFLSLAWYFPELDATIAFSVNGVSPKIQRLREDFLDELLILVFTGVS